MNSSSLGQNIKTFFSRHTLQQKLGMAGAAAMVVGLLWTMVHYVGKVEMQVLYSDLKPEEAHAIAGKLGTLQVAYELAQDGRSISVPADKITELRLQLASEGLPETGQIGFALFDRTTFGMTNFQEQVNLQRALEGELARSVMTLDEVASARVHLVLGKESLYQAAENQTKASVILKLKGGRSVPAYAVQGIVRMVASSVKDLSPDRVTVIDFRGKLLSRADGDDGLSGQQLDARGKVEADLANKIVKILEPAVGPGRVRPQVSVAMNFQRMEETIEQYDPEGSVVRSQQRQGENGMGGNGGQVGGIVSPKPLPVAPVDPVTGLPAPLAAQQAGGRQSEVVNYENSKSVRHIVNPVGTVERVSVAVLIDNPAVPAAPGAKPPASTPRKPEEMKKYRDLVSAAIDLNPDRGDQLTVENVSFETEVESLPEPNPLERFIPMALTGVRYLMIPVVFLFLYLLFIRPVQKTVFAAWTPAPAGAGAIGQGFAGDVKTLPRAGGAQTPMTVKQLEARLKSGGQGGQAEGQSTADSDDFANTAERELLPLPAPSRMDMIRKRVVEHTKQDPETVARLVRIWLNEDKNK